MDVLFPTLRTMVLPDGPGLSAGGTDIERLPECPTLWRQRLEEETPYAIMPQRSFESLQQGSAIFASVLLKSRGSNPEGDTPLVLVHAIYPEFLPTQSRVQPATPCQIPGWFA